MEREQAEQVRNGEVILGNEFDANRENHVRSGFRVVGQNENGLQVVRIHGHYLTEQPNNPWTLRWDQLKNCSLFTNGQLPLL